MKRAFKEKATVLVLAILFIVILFEVGLRIFAHFHTKSTVPLEKNTKKMIAFYGDSFTYGLGSPAGKDFPSQLEKILKNKYEKEIEVINNGVDGYNSTQIYELLKNHINTYKPRVVGLMVGGANSSNYIGYTKSDANLFFKTHIFLCNNLKIYKLCYLLWKNISYQLNKYKINDILRTTADNTERQLNVQSSNEELFGVAQEYFQKGEYENALKTSEQILDMHPDDKVVLCFKATVLNRMGEYKKAIGLYEKAIDQYPQFSDFCSNLGMAYENIGRVDDAIRAYERGIELDPRNDINYYGMAHAYVYGHGDLEKILSILEKYKKDNPLAENYFKMMSSFRNAYSDSYLTDDMKRWLERDFNAIVDICESNNIQIIFQTYPYVDPINEFIRVWSMNNDIILIDHEKEFVKLDPIAANELYAPDGHCNEKGYNLMAGTIAEKLIKEKIVE